MSQPPRPPSVPQATRRLRISLVLLVVLGLQWRFANPSRVLQDPDLFATAWAMLALLPVFGLGAWAYEVTSRGQADFKADALWGVFAATACYLAIFVATLLV